MPRLPALLLIACVALPAHAAPSAAHGKALFASRCASCHAVGPSARSGFAPQLTGIVGRRAGAATDFAYSPAMKKSGLLWTEPNLIRFLQAPDEVVPGTKMRFWGLNPQQAADVAAWLRAPG